MAGPDESGGPLFTLRYRIGWEDLSRFWITNAWWGGFFRKYMTFVFALMAAFVLIGFMSGGPSYLAWNQLLLGLVFPIFWFAGLPMIFFWQSRRSVRRIRALQGEILAVFDRERVEFQDVTSRSCHSWQAFLRFRETTRFFVLHQTDAVGILILKRAFAGEGRVAAFRDLLRSRIGVKAVV